MAAHIQNLVLPSSTISRLIFKELMLEVAVYGVLTAVWWISSATFLLPFLIVLKYNQFLRNLWFSFFFTKVFGPIYEYKTRPMRKKVFDLLKKNLKQKEGIPLKVLEIGIGFGFNFEFYPRNSILTALDVNAKFETYFNKNKIEYPNVFYDRTVISSAEDMKDIDDSSMDLVISTYVLCFVNSIDDCMKEIMRVLKPGGKFLFLEHVGYPKSDWSSSVQNMAEPLWKMCFRGCCLTKNTASYIKNAWFSDVICENVYPEDITLFIRPHIYGLATK